ncbi:MAG TPA: hypothetical protein VK324_07300 [Tepidisphaeraceae bacterium]|nr:hypothetical protein [Tepidisphaeraceae bacterium]
MSPDGKVLLAISDLRTEDLAGMPASLVTRERLAAAGLPLDERQVADSPKRRFPLTPHGFWDTAVHADAARRLATAIDPPRAAADSPP